MLLSLTTGAAQGVLNTQDIARLPVPCPPMMTQEKISSILSAYDDLIENNMRRIQILEEMARRTYEEWFVRFRFPGHENATMTESELGLIPNGWRVAFVSDIASLVRGKSYKSSELSDADDGLPFVNLKCMGRDGGFRKDGLKRFTGTFKESQKVHQGDVVIAVTDMTQERRIVGRSARIPKLDCDFGIISMDLVKMIPKGESSQEYVYSMLRWSGFADEVKLHANGANVLHLLPDRILKYRFPKPQDSVIEEFTTKTQSVLLLIDILNEKSEKLSRTRDLLLPKLISGEIDVSNFPEPE